MIAGDRSTSRETAVIGIVLISYGMGEEKKVGWGGSKIRPPRRSRDL